MSMRSIYRKIAKENGVSVKEVKEEMQKAIEYTWKNENKNEFEAAHQARVPSKGEIPAPEELIRYVAERTKNRL